MRKDHLIVLASAALVITAAATSLYGRPAQTTMSAVTTLDPAAMHYGTMPAQEMTDRTFVFTE
jgi:hypothetical protein